MLSPPRYRHRRHRRTMLNLKLLLSARIRVTGFPESQISRRGRVLF